MKIPRARLEMFVGKRIKARNFCRVERKGYTTFSERGIIVPAIAVFTPFERDTIPPPLSRRSGSLWTGFKIIKGNPFPPVQKTVTQIHQPNRRFTRPRNGKRSLHHR